MIKNFLYTGLCLILLTSIEAIAYEPSVQNSFDQQDTFDFNNTTDIDIEEYIDTEEAPAHGHGPRRHRRQGRCCHPVTVPVGPLVWQYYWGYWRWYQPTTVVQDCHIVIIERPDPPRRPRPRPPRRPRYPHPSDHVEDTYCDQLRRSIRGMRDNSLFNAICNGHDLTVENLLNRGSHYVNERGFTGENALILATKLDDMRIVRLLIQDFDANVCLTHQGLMAVDWAYELEHERMFRYLERRSSHCFDDFRRR